MKKIIIIFIMTILISSNLFAQNYKNTSISFDPLTFIIAALPSSSDNQNTSNSIENIWLCVDLNWETEKQKEMGVGIFLGMNQIYLKTQYRSFYNKERQSGFFWGIYGLLEWRKMYWFYENNELGIGWSIPFNRRDNVYYSIGITGGFDIGFRIRMGNFGITPYLGLGIPLYFCFTDLPPKDYNMEFYVINTAVRAINIGIKLDFFTFFPNS
jgi:hypothetical protein